MTFAQKFVTAVLPERWATNLRAKTKKWQLRCCTCGAIKSAWDTNAIRWGAAPLGKRVAVYCSHCRGIRIAAVEQGPQRERVWVE